MLLLPCTEGCTNTGATDPSSLSCCCDKATVLLLPCTQGCTNTGVTGPSSLGCCCDKATVLLSPCAQCCTNTGVTDPSSLSCCCDKATVLLLPCTQGCINIGVTAWPFSLSSDKATALLTHSCMQLSCTNTEVMVSWSLPLIPGCCGKLTIAPLFWGVSKSMQISVNTACLLVSAKMGSLVHLNEKVCSNDNSRVVDLDSCSTLLPDWQSFWSPDEPVMPPHEVFVICPFSVQGSTCPWQQIVPMLLLGSGSPAVLSPSLLNSACISTDSASLLTSQPLHNWKELRLLGCAFISVLLSKLLMKWGVASTCFTCPQSTLHITGWHAFFSSWLQLCTSLAVALSCRLSSSSSITGSYCLLSVTLTHSFDNTSGSGNWATFEEHSRIFKELSLVGSEGTQFKHSSAEEWKAGMLENKHTSSASSCTDDLHFLFSGLVILPCTKCWPSTSLLVGLPRIFSSFNLANSLSGREKSAIILRGPPFFVNSTEGLGKGHWWSSGEALVEHVGAYFLWVFVFLVGSPSHTLFSCLALDFSLGDLRGISSWNKWLQVSFLWQETFSCELTFVKKVSWLTSNPFELPFDMVTWSSLSRSPVSSCMYSLACPFSVFATFLPSESSSNGDSLECSLDKSQDRLIMLFFPWKHSSVWVLGETSMSTGTFLVHGTDTVAASDDKATVCKSLLCFAVIAPANTPFLFLNSKAAVKFPLLLPSWGLSVTEFNFDRNNRDGTLVVPMLFLNKSSLSFAQFPVLSIPTHAFWTWASCTSSIDVSGADLSCVNIKPFSWSSGWSLRSNASDDATVSCGWSGIIRLSWRVSMTTSLIIPQSDFG